MEAAFRVYGGLGHDTHRLSQSAPDDRWTCAPVSPRRADLSCQPQARL